MTIQQLPIIDIAPYLSSRNDSASRKKVAESIHIACRDVGFFYLDVSSYISQEEMNEILDLGRDFFHRPQEEKDAIGLKHGDGCRGT